jgi:serine O-acetyltransferase
MGHLRNAVNKDLYRCSGATTLKTFFRFFFKNPSFRFLVVKRTIQHTHRFNPLRMLLLLYYKKLKVKYGFQIPPMTSIGPGFVINHFGNIVINQGVVIGNDCSISQGVTLGKVDRGALKGNPTIGDRVWIGANAVIVGKITIGNDVLIAPLSYVAFDLPDKAVVMGNPAQIVNYNSSAVYIKNTH